ncbi:hypothetical protein Tco_1173352 [Tanacetum coccineum]
MKCTSAIRQLSYDNVPDALDEYLQMCAKTSRDALEASFMMQLLSSTIPTFQYHPFLIASSMDQGDEVSNLWVTITSENVAITFDAAAKRVQSVQDIDGYLSGPMPYNGGVKIEELVPFDSGYNYGPVGDTSHSSGFEERHHSLLVVNEELSILMGGLRRKRGASERCWNELNVMLDARDGDKFLQRQEIDRLAGENRDLRAHIGSLEFEITRLRRELEGVITDMLDGQWMLSVVFTCSQFSLYSTATNSNMYLFAFVVEITSRACISKAIVYYFYFFRENRFYGSTGVCNAQKRLLDSSHKLK